MLFENLSWGLPLYLTSFFLLTVFIVVVFRWKRDSKNWSEMLISTLLLGLIFWGVTEYILVPMTDIDVDCLYGHFIPLAGNVTSIGVVEQRNLSEETEGLILNFKNNANFAGEDFNIIIKNVYPPVAHGGGFVMAYNCELKKDIYSQPFSVTHFLCGYIPPKSNIDLTIETKILNENESILISYWSKTTPERIDLKCEME